jgi:hypothetical protein
MASLIHWDNSFIHSFYLTFHRSTKITASLGYRTCPEYATGYINYISLWDQTDSKSYISAIGYSRGTKPRITRYTELPQLQNWQSQTQPQTEELVRHKCQTFSEWDTEHRLHSLVYSSPLCCKYIILDWVTVKTQLLYCSISYLFIGFVGFIASIAVLAQTTCFGPSLGPSSGLACV